MQLRRGEDPAKWQAGWAARPTASAVGRARQRRLYSGWHFLEETGKGERRAVINEMQARVEEEGSRGEGKARGNETGAPPGKYNRVWLTDWCGGAVFDLQINVRRWCGVHVKAPTAQGGTFHA